MHIMPYPRFYKAEALCSIFILENVLENLGYSPLVCHFQTKDGFCIFDE